MPASTRTAPEDVVDEDDPATYASADADEEERDALAADAAVADPLDWADTPSFRRLAGGAS